MKHKALCAAALAALMLGCLAGAVRAGDIPPAESSAAAAEAAAPALFRTEIQAGQVARADQPLHFVAGEMIRLNVSYMPAGELNFGFLDPDGKFCYLKASGDHIDKLVIVEKTGDYTLQIRNTASTEIRLSGYIEPQA